MFAQLGDIVFDGVLGPDSLSIQGDETYSEHALINRRPKLDHTGTGLRSISMGIQFHFSFCTPEFNVAAMWAHKEAADILTFILGNGRIIGDFVITSITESPSETDPLGNYICVKLSVTLKEVYSEIKTIQIQQAARAAAFAFAENGPAPVRIRSKEWITEMWKVTELIMTVKTIVAAVSNVIKYASVPEFWAFASSQLGVYLAIGINAHQGVIDEMLADSDLGTLCPDLGADTLASMTIMVSMQSALPITDYGAISAQATASALAFEAMMQSALKMFVNVIFRK